MLLDHHQRELAARCLWLLQESDSSIVGALLSQANGLSLASTVSEETRVQRLAAVSTALLRLSEWVSTSWGRGAAEAVWLHLGPAQNPLLVQLLAVDYDGILILVFHRPPTAETHQRVQLTIDYLAALIRNDELPPLNLL